MKLTNTACRRQVIVSALALILSFVAQGAAADAPAVSVFRIPQGAIQPQTAVDSAGVFHLIYLQGDPASCDIFYIHSKDEGATWSKPMRVNSDAGSAVAIGTVRGAHLAVGRKGRVHVAWMGASTADSRKSGKIVPMLYARLRDDGVSFEPQRNLITDKPGLDGGGSVAADELGHVYVAWHAPVEKGGDESTRTVWVSQSDDDGKAFAPETALSKTATGACACCGMRIFADGGKLLALYRSATEAVHRDIYLVPRQGAANPIAQKVAPVEVATCVMSTAALAKSPSGYLAAWETNKQIQFATVEGAKSIPANAIITLPGESAAGRKHPAIAANAAGQTMVVWAEGTGWNKGGVIRWQAFTDKGIPIAQSAGQMPGLPAWGTPAVFVKKVGGFLVVF